MVKRSLAAAVVVLAAVLAGTAGSGAASPPAFSNTLLLSPCVPGLLSCPATAPNANSSGNSEPAIDFGGPDNTMAVDGLGWLSFQVDLWKGHFGDTPPAFFGAMDTQLPIKGNGRLNVGDEDADVEVTSAGTILLADLDLVINGGFNNAQLGISVTRCPASASGPSGCTSQVLDTAGADREWITTNGTTAWLSYHDSKSSSIIRVWRSTDDGQTWTKVGSPIQGQGKATGNATFNNTQGPIVADPKTGNVYDAYAAGEASVQKGTSADFNNIYVSRSTDGGETWTANLVYHAPRFTALNNIFPALGVDPTNGTLYAAWSDRSAIWVSSSSNQGSSWTDPTKVSTATTVVMPWVAALGGKVDVVYYGTSASSVDATSAVWNVYDSQLSGGSWKVKTVSNTPNRVGAVCLNGSACAGNTNRELLDLFEVAENPANGKAAVIYTETTIDTYATSSGPKPLPEIVLAYEQ